MTWADERIDGVPERHPQHRAGDFVNPEWFLLHALCMDAAYGRPVSRAMENRAAVFTNQSQDVEVYQDGVWWPGSLLGWRHDTNGSCQVWVRIRIGGSESTVWTELHALRLPDPAPDRAVAPVSPSWAERAPVVSEAPATRELQKIDDRAPAADVPPWRRAAARAEQVATPGRHRAPAAPGAGRHRAADTEVFRAVTDVDSTIRQRLTPAPAAGHRAPHSESDADVFTRRLRLNPLAGSSAPQLQTTGRNRRLS